jgi:hypothetical protein
MTVDAAHSPTTRCDHSPQVACGLISDEDLLQKFVSAPMMAYFRAKFPNLDHTTLETRICELLKFLILMKFSPGRILFRQEIDDVWHYWILQTREYRRLCETLPGNLFRDHSSMDYPETAAAAEAISRTDGAQRILSFFISYYRNFGPITRKRLECWPPLQRFKRRSGWNLNELNNFLRHQAFGAIAAGRV